MTLKLADVLVITYTKLVEQKGQCRKHDAAGSGCAYNGMVRDEPGHCAAGWWIPPALYRPEFEEITLCDIWKANPILASQLTFDGFDSYESQNIWSKIQFIHDTDNNWTTTGFALGFDMFVKVFLGYLGNIETREKAQEAIASLHQYSLPSVRVS